jgi:hypothetical protein
MNENGALDILGPSPEGEDELAFMLLQPHSSAQI